ncbi:collagen-like protein, partial [Lactococcus lactis]
VSSTGDGTPLHIGDTVRIQDKNFIDSDGNVGLFLSARVSELEISFTNPTNNKITFSNYIKLKSEVSDDLTARMQEIINANTPYRSELSTTNGTQFKNGVGTTKLGAHIYFGSDDKEKIADSYEWSKDGTVVAPTQTITVDASGVADKAVYSFKATVAGKVVASQSVTITNVNDGAKGAQGPQGPQGPQGLKGDPGATGIPGQAGADGKTSYLHIAYATNSTGTAGFDVSNATGKTYIGQYTDFTQADSTDPSKYTWSLIKGDKGDRGNTGPQGPQGERGIAGATGATGSLGPKGADGRSSYIHIKYAPVINPTDSQITDTPNAYIGVYTDYNQADSTSASAYTWSKWQGEDGANGVAGAKGADGRTTYVHFAYANSTNGQTNFSTSYFDGALYMGTLTDYTQTDSTNYAAYTWSRLKGDKGDKGEQGAQGIQGLQGPAGTQGVAGPKGADGKTQYTHIAYANSADGVTDFSTSDSNRAYIGMYVDFNINDSTTPSDYSWTLVKGADGTQGTPGKAGGDGKTPYFHTAWS